MTFTKRRAVECAELLLQKMHGDGWVADVFENLGWHYMVRRESSGFHCSVSPSWEFGMYRALIGESRSTGIVLNDGLSFNSKSFEDPNEAVAHEVQRIANRAAVLNRLADAFREGAK